MGETSQATPRRRGSSTFSILERIDVGETGPTCRASPAPIAPFSILERIDVGETFCLAPWMQIRFPFSILERIDVGETIGADVEVVAAPKLSVSSNGSTWVKLTMSRRGWWRIGQLSVSSNGSTWVKLGMELRYDARDALSFSILERIDVGETSQDCAGR